MTHLRISSDDGEPEPELVAFIIGPKSRTFTIAASTLIPLSDDFKIDYDPRFRDPEADSLTTRWPTESVTLFEYFQRWIYSSSILDRHQTVDDISWEQLLDLYCFGKDHEIPTFTNHIINTFIDKSEISGTVPTHLIRRIYNATKLAPEYVDFPPEHLRKWIVHKSCAVRKKSWFNTEVKRANYPDEFLFNMLYQESTDKYPNTDFRAFRWKFTVYERLMSDWDIVLTIKKRTGRQVVLREEPPRVLREATTSEDEDEVRRQRFVDRYFG